MSKASDFGKATKYQTKSVGAISVTTADITALKFNNLTIGKTYCARLQVSFAGLAATANENSRLQITNNGVPIATIWFRQDSLGDTTYLTAGDSGIFTAAANTMIAAFDKFSGSIDVSNARVILEELPDHVETTEWT